MFYTGIVKKRLQSIAIVFLRYFYLEGTKKWLSIFQYVSSDVSKSDATTDNKSIDHRKDKLLMFAVYPKCHRMMEGYSKSLLSLWLKSKIGN